MSQEPELARDDTPFAVWREELKAYERTCPWPGPRPFDKQDNKSLLVGREETARQFRQAVDAHKIVELHGPSGVGKTSLLRASLRPTLEEAGKVVGYCDDWSRIGGAEKAGQFLAKKLYPQFRHVPGAEPTPALFPRLHQAHGDNVVLILDQFEELIRYSPGRAEAMKGLVGVLARRYDIKVVLSFRSEFLHEMQELEKGLGPWTVTSFALGEIDDSFAHELIVVVNGEGTEVITRDAAQRVAEAWTAARGPRERSDADPFGRVGLLHLQGVLYALHRRAAGRTIETRDVDQLAASPEGLFRQGLIDAVKFKVDLCFEAAKAGLSGADSAETTVDPWLRSGTRKVIADMARHLTSAGYKLVREVQELLGSVLGGDLDRLEAGIRRAGGGDGDGPLEASQRAELLRALLDLTDAHMGGERRPDLLTARTSELAAWVDGRPGSEDSSPTWGDRLHPGAEPWVADPMDVTCGPLMGAAPGRAFIEEVRQFAFAIACLRESSLIRTTSPDTLTTHVSLIHDGFGRALELWAEEQLRDPDLELYRLTAPSGATYYWKDLERPRSLVGETDDRRLLTNLRWRGSWVAADFRHVTFVNCDFRGCFFHDCTFEGVTMLNCQLDGAIFSECDVEGPADLYAGEWEPNLPTFFVEEAPVLTAAIANYREVPDAEGLLADEPGRPARPAVATDANDTWTQEPGGLVLYGGRVSSLVFRSTQVHPGSLLAFRDVAGSGLDIVEHGGGRYEFHGSALRHITITDDGDPETGADYEVHSVGCKLVQVWVGDGVHGTWRAENCQLVQIHDGSAMRFTVDGTSAYFQLDGLDVDPTAEAIDGLSETLIEDFAAKMDYRRNPAQTLHERRAGR